MQWSNKKWIGIVVGLVFLILAAGGYYLITSRQAAEAAASQEPAMQTAVARRGELIITASGAGSLIPAAEIGIGFDQSGVLIELNVNLGDKVQKGDVLARLETTQSPEEIAVAVSEAELQVLQAQQSLDELHANAEIARTNALNDIATYAQEVRDAQYQLENYTLPTYLQGLDTIEALDRMKERLDAAWAAFEPYRYYPADDPTRQELLEALNNAQAQYDAAVKHLNYEYTLQVAQANLEKARQEYEKYKDGPAADELALAEAELANAQTKLALAREEQAVIDLVAPIDGTVLVIDATVGETLGASAIITLADLEQPLIEVYLDETDLDKAVVGYPAEVVFDALPDRVFSGQVVSVSPSLENVSNVQAVKVLVSLDADSLQPGDILPVGLNASVDIIAGQAENAILVPVEALREISPGEYAVFVLENGEPTLHVVEVGLVDITYAEILSGVEEGDVVTTGIVQTK